MSKRPKKPSSGTNKKVVHKTVGKEETTSEASGLGIKSLAPLKGLIAIIFITLATFNGSADSGSADLKNTLGKYILKETEYECPYSLDSLGLNNCTSCYSSKNGPAILTLGYSFTCGMGAVDGKSWPQQLEGILASKGFGDSRVCTGGVQGSDPVYMLEALKSVYEKQFFPDLIIQAIHPSDIMDIVVHEGMDRYTVNRPAIEHQKWLPFYASSLVFRSYMRSVKHIDPALLIPEELKAPMIYDAYAKSFETRMAIKQYQAMKGKKVVLAYTPIVLDINNGSSSLRDILSEARMQVMHVVDATEAFLGNGVNAGNMGQFFWPLDSHNTEKGYPLIANTVSEYLISKINFWTVFKNPTSTE